MATHLVAPRQLVSALPLAVQQRAHCLPATLDDARWDAVLAGLAAGDALILIGSGALPRLRPLWVATHECPASDLRAAGQALPGLPPVAWRPAACRGLTVRPDTLHAYFGRDEMPRATLVPLVEAVDDSGHPCAYPAVVLKHVAPSLIGGRFAGSNWCLFAMDDPLAAAASAEWAAIVEALLDHAASPVSLTEARVHYSCQRPGETVMAGIRVANRSSEIAAVRLDLTALGPDGAARLASTVRPLRRGLAAPRPRPPAPRPVTVVTPTLSRPGPAIATAAGARAGEAEGGTGR